MPDYLIVLGAVVVVGVVIALVFRASKKGGSSPSRPASANPSSAGDKGVRVNWLVGIAGPVEGKTFHIGERTVTIGRGVSNFVQIVEDSNASRVHCQLQASRGGVRVKDMESQNGTLVNGEKVVEHDLQEGDTLKVGDSVFTYHRRAEFDINHGLDRKAAGAKALKPTMAGTQQSLQGMAFAALEEQGGDHHKAAATLGLKIDDFRKLLEDSK